MARAILGLRAHSGWAALVAIAGTAKDPEVVDRRRIVLAGPKFSNQPYHRAEALSVERAATFLERCSNDSRRLAEDGLRATISALSQGGHRVAGCALLLASGRPLPPLASVLSSHALIHAADGEHYREALSRAAESLGLPVARVREKDVWTEASAALGARSDAIADRVSALGKPLGPPWTQDQKLAAAAAWLALAQRGSVS